MRHTLEALSDPSPANVADLKLRIEEMLRIKVKINLKFTTMQIYQLFFQLT